MNSFLSIINTTAKSISKSITDEYNELKATPKKIKCSGANCVVELDVPSNIFDWVCSSENCRKLNTRESNECVNCKAIRTKVLNPTIQCPKCGTNTIVPSSNASKHLQTASKNTKEFVVKTAKSAKETYNNLKSAPSEFNCEHCTSLLAVPPSDPWLCPRNECAHQNADGCDYELCAKCNVKRDVPVRQVMCGVCQLVTKVPSTNFANKVKVNLKELDRSTKKIYYDLAGKNYIVCPRCSAPLKLKDKPKEEKNNEQKGDEQKGETQQSIDASAPVSSSQIQIEGQIEGQTQQKQEGELVVCEKCQEKVILQMRPQQQPQPQQVQGPSAVAKQ